MVVHTRVAIDTMCGVVVLDLSDSDSALEIRPLVDGRATVFFSWPLLYRYISTSFECWPPVGLRNLEANLRIELQ